MKSLSCVLLCALTCSLSLAQAPEKKIYPKRWVYVSNELGSDKDLAAVRQIIETAAAHGLNGMVFAAGLDRIDLQPAAYIARLKEVKQLCDRLHFEIAPIGFGTGYGGALLSHDKNLAEGLPVKGALYIAGSGAGKGKAEFQAEAEPFVLPTTGAEPVTRFDQQLAVKPYRCYRVSARVRGTGVAPDATLEFRADTPDKKRNECWFERPVDNRREWQSYTTAFNSGPNDKLNFNIAIEDGLAGKLELADLRIEEVGLLNVLRRAGTPLAVHGENGILYFEGRDYARIADPVMDFLFDRPSVAITLPARSRIKPGERLRVDYYHGMTIYKDQTPACPSEPKVFQIWGKQLPLIQRYLAPKAYLLSVDEERMGGTCETCKRRKMGMAEMIGDYVTRVEAMMKAASPGAEIFVWSDMFDPNHNAVPNYYLVDGDYTGSWKYLPKDVEIAAWNYDTRAKSLPFFSGLGYKTLAAAYYDADDLNNPAGWLESLDRTPGAIGIMYTTWQNKFKLLPAFGDMVSQRK
ncbi:MAG: hypothetical protein ACLQBJ_02710 [Bryobacteraceae bacterium]